MISKRAAKRFGVVVLILLLVLAGAVYWLFYDNELPSSGKFNLDLTRIRAAASSRPGPERIEVEEVSHTFVPKIGVVGGTSWRSFDMMRCELPARLPGPGNCARHRLSAGGGAAVARGILRSGRLEPHTARTARRDCDRCDA